MSKSVVSFTKPTGQVTPYWLLQQMAGIDAVLIFKFADEFACIKYDVPTERMPRADYLRGIVNGASGLRCYAPRGRELESLREIGFINPIRVRPIMVSAGPIRQVPGWEITSGRHRFQAASRLRNEGDMRFDTVPCDVVENEDDRLRDLAEIDENLCRAELSQGERARHTARRKEIFEEIHPETKHGGAPAKRGGKGGKEGKDPNSGSLGFIDATAKAIGKSRTTVSLDAERGEKINGKALDVKDRKL